MRRYMCAGWVRELNKEGFGGGMSYETTVTGMVFLLKKEGTGQVTYDGIGQGRPVAVEKDIGATASAAPRDVGALIWTS